MLRVDFNQLVLNKKYLIPTNNKYYFHVVCSLGKFIWSDF